ncbi:uncharacterized protein [Gossypium hirsutum]|uniref:Tf2-1-like SH3-like domain-containing protein n=1 Tax=Gossypium hirsutum TaxID=3635 RepID=A0A1U8NIS3_GOSHI|nr:uncharacterized protein LOC107947890 [Gossypium hirsutum]
MAPYESLYGCKFHTPLCWIELGERRFTGPNLVPKIEDKVRLIRDHLKAASNRKKSYADLKKRDIEFTIGDRVFLKVSLLKKNLRFGCKGKLSPRFIRSYWILKCVGTVAYQLELPPKLDRIHDIFYVSMLRQYQSDLYHIVSIEKIKVRLDLNFEEKSAHILDRKVKVLSTNAISLVKVLWRNHGTEEVTWEHDDSI